MALISSAPPPDTTGAMSHLTVLTPVLADRRGRLEAVLARWNRASPFARVPVLHLARLTILDDLRGPRGFVRVDPARLVFAATVDGRADDIPGMLASLMGDACDELWACCDGYPGVADTDAFGAYLHAHRIVADLAFATFTASVDEVRAALALQQELGRIVARGPSVDASALRAAVEALR
jgi:hypothetical protein